MAAHHRWGRGSLIQRATLHSDLVRFVDELLRRSTTDLKIDCGHRDKASQEAAFAKKASKARWGQSPHNRMLSYAVDVHIIAADGTIPWNDRAAWDALGDLGEDVARDLGLPVTWGGRFSGFYDGPHFELAGWKSVAVAG